MIEDIAIIGLIAASVLVVGGWVELTRWLQNRRAVRRARLQREIDRHTR